MAKRILKCKYCNEEFDANKEPFVNVGGRRYAHEACAEKYKQSFTQEELDYQELETYLKVLFKKPVTVRIKKQIKDYREEYGYTYSGILKTLKWWFDINNNSIEKANNGIGIVPYVYEQAYDYYYRLYMAQKVNDWETLSNYEQKIKEIEIESPRVYVQPPRLFNFEEEE